MSVIRDRFYDPDYALPGGESNALCHFDSAYGLDFLNQLQKPDIYKLQFEGLELKEVTRLGNE